MTAREGGVAIMSEWTYAATEPAQARRLGARMHLVTAVLARRAPRGRIPAVPAAARRAALDARIAAHAVRGSVLSRVADPGCADLVASDVSTGCGCRPRSRRVREDDKG